MLSAEGFIGQAINQCSTSKRRAESPTKSPSATTSRASSSTTSTPPASAVRRKMVLFFLTTIRKTGQLTDRAIHVNDVCRMMKRRLKDAGLPDNPRRTPSASPRSQTCSSRAFRSKTCSAWPVTPIRAQRAPTVAATRKSHGMWWSGFQCELAQTVRSSSPCFRNLIDIRII